MKPQPGNSLYLVELEEWFILCAVQIGSDDHRGPLLNKIDPCEERDRRKRTEFAT